MCVARVCRVRMPVQRWLAVIPAILLSLLAAAGGESAVERLPLTTLQGPYRLTFRVTQEDVRTPAERANDHTRTLAKLRLEARNTLDLNDRMAVVRAALGSAALPENRVRTFDVTLVSDGNHIFYRANELRRAKSVLESSRSISTIIIFDGQQTFTLRGGYLQRRLNFAPQDMFYCPLAAVGLDRIDLLRNPANTKRQGASRADTFRCLAPLKNSGETGPFVYIPGSATIRNRGRVPCVSRLVSMNEGRPLEEWLYKRHVKFKGVWLARESVWIKYRVVDKPKGGRSTGKPAYKTSFLLTGANDDAPDLGYFDVRTYLKRPVLVDDYTASSTIRYSADQHAPDFDVLRDKAFVVVAQNSGRGLPAEFFLLVFGFFLAVFVVFKKIRRSYMPSRYTP
jgi:hypothetical protein